PMTDRTTITLNADWDLMIAPHEDGIRLSLIPGRDTPAHVSVPVATSALLAAIDAADPDAMRAYLRERSDYLDSPHDLDAVPEADSPEDIPGSLVRRFYRAEAMLDTGSHLIAQASEVLDSIDAELNR